MRPPVRFSPPAISFRCSSHVISLTDRHAVGSAWRCRWRSAPRVLATAAVSAAPAAAVEAGVNIGASASQIADAEGARHPLGAHVLELARDGADAGAHLPQLARLLRTALRPLPAGTKVILDVVDSPEWETGSSDEHTPPANPQDYAAFVGALAERFGHARERV